MNEDIKYVHHIPLNVRVKYIEKILHMKAVYLKHMEKNFERSFYKITEVKLLLLMKSEALYWTDTDQNKLTDLIENRE